MTCVTKSEYFDTIAKLWLWASILCSYAQPTELVSLLIQPRHTWAKKPRSYIVCFVSIDYFTLMYSKMIKLMPTVIVAM